MAMMAAYWHKDGLEIYRFEGKEPVKQASGSLDGLKAVRGVLDKKVLVVSRELLFHTRKRYPPASINKLARAVALEIKEIFPISKPAFQYKVFESSAAYIMLDIWAWESEAYARLREVFPFNYIVPEDLTYFSDIPKVKIFQYRGMTHVLACSGDRVLGGASYPDSGINERELERFLSGLGRYRSEIKQLEIYGPLAFEFKEAGISTTTLVQGDHPACMDYLYRLNLSEFKVKGNHRLPLKVDFLFRVSIYLILGYGLMLYQTAKNYDQTTTEIRQKINEIDARMSKRGAGKTAADFSEVVREVNEKLSTRHSPLKVMDRLAQNLPAGSLITRIILDENTVEVSATSENPLSVVKALGSAEGIKTARLKGTPARDSQTGSYNFVIAIEFLR